jgi:4-amino-4-deoxy-L-arabinose transferase-like glycosyltransferase
MKRRSAIVALVARYQLGLMLALALALRLLLWHQPLHQLANDEIEYVSVARDLLGGRGWQFYDHYYWLRAPLYPLFLAASLWLAGGDLHRAALPNIALSVATVSLSYWLARALVGRRAARVTALCTTLLWTFVTFASLYMSETLFTFLFTGALGCLVRSAALPPAAQIRADTRRYVNWKEAVVPLRGASRIANTGFVPSARGWRWALGAGILFGLATLTRSITLLFLPLGALWLLVVLYGRTRRMRYAVLCAALFGLAALGTIAPWTIRNERAYGHLIPVETGLSYNLWAFNEPRESSNTIFQTLAQISNPAERSAYATAKGLARLREEPAILLRKLWPNWIYLWRVKPIEDRFILESYYADVGLPIFAAALIFDDALYLLIALAAIAGLVHAGRTRPLASPPDHQGSKVKWLVLAWLLYVIATVLLTHGEARYRHFLFPVLIPYAAATLVRVAASRTRLATGAGSRRPSLRHLLLGGLWALLLWPALTFYPWTWAAQNVARGAYALAGDSAWAAGARSQALDAYDRALTAQETPDGWLRLGDAARALGDQPRALDAYRTANRLTPSYIAASARLGDLLRAMGDESGARDAFAGQYADSQRVVDYAWRELRPPPVAQLDVGDGLDFGYVGGVYPAEEQQGATARWTGGQGWLRLRGDAGPQLVRLRLAAPRPDSAAVPVQVCAAGRCWPLVVGPQWRSYSLQFGGVSDGALLVEIRSPTFAAPDERQLGVLIDNATVTRLRR